MATSEYDREITLHERNRTLRWPAVFAGFFVAVGFQILLLAIGAALGITSTSTGGGASRGWGILAAIWTLLSPIAALFLGGLAAGWAARPATRRIGRFHGVVVWCITTVLGAWLIGNIASFTMGSLAGVTGQALSAAATVARGADLSRERGAAALRGQQEALRGRAEGLRAAGQQVANVGTGIAWGTVVSMLLALGASVLGGSRGHRMAVEDEPERHLIEREPSAPLPPRPSPSREPREEREAREVPKHPEDLH